jgi:hypothetical protein
MCWHDYQQKINIFTGFYSLFHAQVCKNKLGWTKLITAGRALKAWQVAKAVNNSEVTVSDMQDELAQVLFESERDALKDEGVPFNRYATKTHMVGRDVFGYGTQQLPWC